MRYTGVTVLLLLVLVLAVVVLVLLDSPDSTSLPQAVTRSRPARRHDHSRFKKRDTTFKVQEKRHRVSYYTNQKEVAHPSPVGPQTGPQLEW